jgi:hypothetical protein
MAAADARHRHWNIPRRWIPAPLAGNPLVARWLKIL